jgi:hypothetical protein
MALTWGGHLSDDSVKQVSHRADCPGPAADVSIDRKVPLLLLRRLVHQPLVSVNWLTHSTHDTDQTSKKKSVFTRENL